MLRWETSSTPGGRGPAAAFKGPPRGHAASLRPEAGSGLRLRTAQQSGPGFPRKASQRGKEGWEAVGGVSPLCKSQRRSRATGGDCDAKPGPPSETRGGLAPQPSASCSRASDVVDVAFKSGRARAVSGNANLRLLHNCLGTLSAPARQTASPPVSPPKPFRESQARRRRCLAALSGASGSPNPSAQAGPRRLRLLGATRRPPRSPHSPLRQT